ncbi:unnamed protein product [Closterium sp. Yama58-4]|nr:unnamed protein product [Closterium sp. Yama58-4]
MPLRSAITGPFVSAFRPCALHILPRAFPPPIPAPMTAHIPAPVAAARGADLRGTRATNFTRSRTVRGSQSSSSSVHRESSLRPQAIRLSSSLTRHATSAAFSPAQPISFATATSARINLRGSHKQSGGFRGLRCAGRADALASGEAGAGVARGGESSAWCVELVPCLTDNYAYLLRNAATGAALVVDPAEAAPVEARLAEGEGRTGGKLAAVLCTHHHWDHTGGNLALKDKFGATVVGPAADRDRIPGIDVALSDGDTWQFEGLEMHVLHTPGHTRGHCVLYFPSLAALFTGDTLFSLGCGRLFEGSPSQMWASLSRIASLPPDTKVYCGHEYTQANARFAMAVEPNNPALQQRVDEITRLRAHSLPTIPSTVGQEAATNPFLRAASPEIRQSLHMSTGAADVDVFAALRRMKDNF